MENRFWNNVVTELSYSEVSLLFPTKLRPASNFSKQENEIINPENKPGHLLPSDLLFLGPVMQPGCDFLPPLLLLPFFPLPHHLLSFLLSYQWETDHVGCDRSSCTHRQMSENTLSQHPSSPEQKWKLGLSLENNCNSIEQADCSSTQPTSVASRTRNRGSRSKFGE